MQICNRLLHVQTANHGLRFGQRFADQMLWNVVAHQQFARDNRLHDWRTPWLT
jgi:hypothetical protein